MTREQALENALRDVQQYVIAWRYEYANKPNDAHNNQQRDRIDAALKQMAAALALPPDGVNAEIFKPKRDETVWIHSMGKRFQLTAIALSDAAANAHMEKHRDHAVIACFGPLVLMAHVYAGVVDNIPMPSKTFNPPAQA